MVSYNSALHCTPLPANPYLLRPQFFLPRYTFQCFPFFLINPHISQQCDTDQFLSRKLALIQQALSVIHIFTFETLALVSVAQLLGMLSCD